MSPRIVVITLLLFAAAARAGDGVAEGDAHWAAGRLDQAAESFRAAISAEPDSPEVRLRLAGLYMARQQYARAVPLYQQVIGFDAGNDRAFIGLGLAYLHQQKALMAEAAFVEAMRINPERRAALEPVVASLRERWGALDLGPPGSVRNR